MCSADFGTFRRFYAGQIPVGIIAVAGDSFVDLAVALDILCFLSQPAVLVVAAAGSVLYPLLYQMFF